jgi:PadR family transcriptional regulator, regulatory protein PadR
MNIQYKKGVIDLLVLSMLEKEDQYGYVISEVLKKEINLSARTVYPILKKLKTEGYVTTYLSNESGGPTRKYYHLTAKGISHLQASKNEWLDFVNKTMEIIEQ